jgi:chromosome segregation protein
MGVFVRLAQIKLAGFKSFVEPTQLVLPGRLVGIVGPNGCGKSNVIDAVRWVLGESKAAELRGETMQDVIFNGSSERRPASRASVELIFDNDRQRISGQWGQFAEISVKRVITRETGSTYYINGQVVRRRDIQDLFLGTGLGPNAYAIIGQGMVSKMVESKPEEMRVYLEEAAGTSRYRERRRETENRLFEARENLNRVSDLQTELSERIVQLEQQASVAMKYRELEAELLLSRRVLAYVRERESALTKQTHLKACEEVEIILLEAQTQVSQLLVRVEQAKQQFDESGLKLQQEQAIFYEASGRVAQIETELRLQNSSRQALVERLEKLTGQAKKLQEDLDNMALESADLEGKLPELEQKRQILEGRLQQANTEMPAVELQYQQARQQADLAREEVMKFRQQLQLISTESRQMDRELDQWKERQKRLQQERGGMAVPQETILRDLDGQILLLDDKEKQLSTDMLHSQQQENLFEQQRKQHQENLTQLQTQLSQTQSRLNVLEQLQREYDAPVAMKQWLKQQGFDGLVPFWQSLTVSGGWSLCVEALLRERMNAIKMNELTRLSMFGDYPPPLRQSFFSPSDRQDLTAETIVGFQPLWKQVEVDPLYQPVLRDWLAGVGCVESLDEALAKRELLEKGQVLVTPKGHMVSRYSLNLLPTQKAETGLLTRQDEIRQLRVLQGEQSQALQLTQQNLRQTQELLGLEKERLRQLRDEQQKSFKLSQELKIKKVRLEEEIERYSLRVQQITIDLEQINQHMVQIQEKQLAHQQLFEEIDLLSAKAQQEQEQKKQAEEEALKGVSFQRSVVQQLEHQHKDALLGWERVQAKYNELQKILDVKSLQQSDIQQEIKDQEQLLLSLTDDQTRQTLQAALDNKQKVEFSLSQVKEQLDQATTYLRQQENLLQEQQQKQEPLRRRLSELQLKEQASRLAMEQFAQELAELGGGSAEVSDRAGEKPQQLQQKIYQVKSQIEALGAVNLMALDELKSGQERLTFLEAQVKDLVEAANTLEEAIRKIDRETRDRLMETFNAVNQYFSEMFPRLFGGGQARLSLSDDDILYAGVHVMAQPPGKRNSSIVLLSGGEKALTATALVFAFFRLNPAPFCLLDEVDAPLDDVNTGRYCDLVKSMVHDTQFIFISHNKIAMEMAQQLIGVTMHEQGVSRVVSVDLESAVQMTQ